MSKMFDRNTSPRANWLFQRILMTFAVLFGLGLSSIEAQESKTDDALRDLKSFEELQKAFESDSGHVRLVTLLSPT
ncbi:hypothetical protein MJD09_16430 [bacterium]|nr:hypothetical protein [bacterium]